MSGPALYPLRFEPIFQYRLWSGRRLSNLLSAPLPEGPVGEAWLLSDRYDHPSRVANGALEGRTLAEATDRSREGLMGSLAQRFERFPLPLKFLDASQMLSVQVHPSDEQPELISAGETSKTEAWVVIAAQQGSRIYAGLQPGTTKAELRNALADGTITSHLVSIDPRMGDAVFIPAGTVHTLGSGIVVFEIQQNSDATYRLYDWGHVDEKTGKPRPLGVEQALACIDFRENGSGPRKPTLETTWPVQRERLFDCDYFRLWRLQAEAPFGVGSPRSPRVPVCILGSGRVEHRGVFYAAETGEVWLLAAETGACAFVPANEATLLEIEIPH